MASVFAVLEKLAPHIQRELDLQLQSDQYAEGLKSKLTKIQKGLKEAEKRVVADETVQDWLKELEEIMFNMVDALDELEVAKFRQENDTLWEKLSSLILSCPCIQQVLDRRELSLRMKSLSDELDKKLEEKGKYVLVPAAADGESSHSSFMHVPTTSQLDKSRPFIGRDLERERLIEKLVSNDDNMDTFQVVSIVGMGGLGKTTLTQSVFTHYKIKDHFPEIRVWVSVPHELDAFAVVKAMLEKLDGKPPSRESTLESLVNRIEEKISQNRFLLVLDDVWTTQYSNWEPLKKCLLNGKQESRVLVTTRNEEVARMMGTTQLYRLGMLSAEDCAEILNGIALHRRSIRNVENLRAIGMKIAERCNGLPLAASHLGALLALKPPAEASWNAVLKSPLWKNDEEVEKHQGVFQVLKLSYLDLDPILKRCFLSCAMYERGTVIKLDELIRIWEAFGYLGNDEDEMKYSKGVEFFENLAMRCFVGRYDDGEAIRFKLHDVMHEFATHLSGRMEHINVKDLGENRGLISCLWKVRSFTCNIDWLQDNYSDLQLQELLSHLKCVRVLKLDHHAGLKELPEEIGKLIHLRYLDLNNSWSLKRLPRSLTDLYHLQTLDLHGCLHLSELPEKIDNLVNMRHLFLHDTLRLGETPEGLQKLKGLHTLTKFCVGKNGIKLGWLEKFDHLHGDLDIFIHAADVQEAQKAKLQNKIHLQNLKIEFNEREMEMKEEVADALQPPPQIELLDIEGAYAQRLPCWLQMDASLHLSQLRDLRIACYDEPVLRIPLWSLPCLENLEFWWVKFRQVATREFLGIDDQASSSSSSGAALSPAPVVGAAGFPKLKTLEFGYCSDWAEWEDIADNLDGRLFPCLKTLKIRYCSHLTGLPHNLLQQATSLEELILSGCSLLNQRYHPEYGTDRHEIPGHIKKVYI